MNGNNTTATYAKIGATFVCVLIRFSRCSSVMDSICFCVREFCWSCRIMKLRQPTRCPKVKMTPTETTTIKISGKIHEGFFTMDSKVGFGLNSTPKIRPNELSEPPVPEEGAGEVAGVGVSALAMLVSSWLNRIDQRHRPCFSLRPA